MKIRTRITLFVIASGLAASLLLSLWLIYELLEQPFRILDTSLREESERAVRMLAQGGIHALEYAEDLDVIPAIWIQIADADTGEILYRSHPAQSLNLENERVVDKSSFDWKDIGKTVVDSAFKNLFRSLDQRKTYRALDYDLSYDNMKLHVRAARSMEKLDEEIREVFWVTVASLMLVTLVLALIGTAVAGKIVRPIDAIRLLAQDIEARNLARRIPPGREDDELGELSKTLNEMLDRLQYSFLRQREYLFDTSHELKTPLTTMRLAIEALCTDNRHSLSDEVRESLHRLEVQVLRMERLVKDLLKLSSLEALHDVDSQAVDIGTLLSDLAAEYRILAEAQAIEISLEVPAGLIVWGDEEKLRRAFSNVLDNSIRYNERAGRVKIVAWRSSETAYIEVCNTGERLTEEDKRRIFDQFYRSEKSRSSQKGGAGLGLTIVKKVVELHKGEVAFERREEGLNCLHLSLPITVPPRENNANPPLIGS